MARNTQTWILAFTVVIAGCTSPTVTSIDPTTAVTTSTSSARVAGSQPVATTRVPHQEPRSLSSTSTSTSTTTTTTTTEAPQPDAVNAESPVITVDLDIAELDDIVAALDQILGDLGQSLAEEEGDVFND